MHVLPCQYAEWQWTESVLFEIVLLTLVASRRVPAYIGHEE